MLLALPGNDDVEPPAVQQNDDDQDDYMSHEPGRPIAKTQLRPRLSPTEDTSQIPDRVFAMQKLIRDDMVFLSLFFYLVILFPFSMVIHFKIG